VENIDNCFITTHCKVSLLVFYKGSVFDLEYTVMSFHGKADILAAFSTILYSCCITG
jgi:hypothetical protein